MGVIVWDRTHNRPADIYTPPEDCVAAPPHVAVEVSVLPDCDLCVHWDFRRDPEKAAFDGRTTRGSWANMCPDHFRVYGTGLGLGKGQHLVLATPAEKGPFTECFDEACDAKPVVRMSVAGEEVFLCTAHARGLVESR